ncbi:hypothetical protein [Streptomyces sp. CB01881]|uniref:hypothetical protein n=1 Tax=Streptomyces sp. CB01881 TaxID=2078691 RepID=UPI001F11B8E8|nr:hypothetical protein [Streptomyces sp. CB01881]
MDPFTDPFTGPDLDRGPDPGTGSRAGLFASLDLAAGEAEASPALDGLVGGILAEVASGARAVRAVAHPLGFFCLPVLRDGALGVCVHVFGPDAAGPRPARAVREIHCHSWELKSSVLYGRVGNLRVGVHDEPVRPTHRAYEVHSAEGTDEIRPTARLVRWEPLGERTSARGETYTLAAGEFHATVLPGGAPAATVVLGRSVPGPVDVVLGPLDGRARRVVRRQCDAARTARIAEAAARRLSEPPSED